MPSPSQAPSFSPAELFRFARVTPPAIIDLRRRARRDPILREVLDRPAAGQTEWARTFLASPDAIADLRDLRYDYFAALGTKTLSSDRLPTREDLKDPAAFAALDVRGDASWQHDAGAALRTLLALRLAPDGTDESKARLDRVARLAAFIDAFPDLHRVTRPRGYAPAILDRTPAIRTVAPPRATAKLPGGAGAGAERSAELRQLADGLLLVWQARNRRIDQRRKQFEAGMREILARGGEPKSPVRMPAAAANLPAPLPAHAAQARGGAPGAADGADGPVHDPGPWGTPRAAEPTRANADEMAGRARILHARSDRLRSLKREHEDAQRGDLLEAVLSGGAADLARFAPGRSEAQVGAILAQVRGYLDKYDITPARFCQAYEEAVVRAEELPTRLPERLDEGYVDDYPTAVFADAIRILGRGELVRVDETFVKYAPGEISYVETVLAGEVRERAVKSTRYFEQVTESTREEVSETSRETSATTKQELKSQVKSELKTRMDSDISASANASGGGTIGVVDVQGAGSVDAKLGVGLDASLATENESQFAQEVLAKALERTRETVTERRMTRSYAMDETSNLHRIDNTVGEVRSRNAIYCFLNKDVAITETTYGQRLFLMANLLAPGRSLLGARLHRLQAALDEAGPRPVFDISPADITRESYKGLAARFRAANVTPPPPPVARLTRTYKTDTTNLNQEQEEFSVKKMADLLVPFFARYKRFLITENVKLPEGYEVMDVNVTVNHGSNGISLPAHLPLSLAGAGMLMGPTYAYYSLYYGPLLIPYWMWEIAYLASPLLHYNADSSNVTVGVGNESQDSPYYFFHPDFLIDEIFSLLGSVTAMAPGIMQKVQEGATTLLAALDANAEAVPGEVGGMVRGTVQGLIDNLRAIFDDIRNGKFKDMWEKVQALAPSVNLAGLEGAMGPFFDPLKQFLQEVIDAINAGLADVIGEFFGFLAQMFESSQTLQFSGASGNRGELPVSLNAIALKPGITVNLTACLRRTEEALAAWQLQTFTTLYQGYQQMVSDYDSRALLTGARAGLAKPPAMLRLEEHEAIKERVLHALNNLHDTPGSSYEMERLNLFEHAFDWSNMTWRAFRYGTTVEEIRLEKEGAFAGVDDRRRAFTTALWAQVMIPVRDDANLERQVIGYFDNGTFDLEAQLQEEELVALYGDLVSGRERDVGVTSPPRFVTVPTEFIAIMTDDLESQLPRNPAFAGNGA